MAWLGPGSGPPLGLNTGTYSGDRNEDERNQSDEGCMRKIRKPENKAPSWLGLAWLGFLVVYSFVARADHIVGGDLTMRAVGSTPGLFRVQLNQFWNDATLNAGNRDPQVRVLIYRKRNPILIETIILPYRDLQPVTYGNAVCANLQQLSTSEARYYVNHPFDPARYTDPDGYYMVWERCCRNDNLTNIDASNVTAGIGMAFYLEFPPMRKAGQSFVNSTPDFNLPNGTYLCVGKTTFFSFGATDADGDQLRYSLVTSFNGYTTRTTFLGDTLPKLGYPPIIWAPGYSAANAIPGNPPLRIDANTGQLTVRATQQGLFAFTVLCEEFRNGARIGAVRRDFQLPVVDCARNAPPPPVITINQLPLTDTTWCADRPLVLAVERDARWAYQWQRNGNNLRGDTTALLRVTESGEYTVIRSQARVCASDTVSQAVRVRLEAVPTVRLAVAGPLTQCLGDTVTIRASGPADGQYRWNRNGNDWPRLNSPVADTTARVAVVQSQSYQVTVTTPAGCTATSNVLSLTGSVRPTVTFDSLALICGLSTGPVALRGQPAAGTFAGPGVTGNQFVPAAAGLGRHELTYTVQSGPGCEVVESRSVVVGQEPQLSDPTAYRVMRGERVQIQVGVDQPIARYEWQPPTELSRADIAEPEARPTASRTYDLTVESAAGCVARRTVRVEVIDPIHIPSAFSPNADGQNDVWLITNLRAYPQCEVVVFNRWGERIFQSIGYAEPWDGTYRQQRVVPGVYTYQIRTEPGSQAVTYRGQLIVL